MRRSPINWMALLPIALLVFTIGGWVAYAEGKHDDADEADKAMKAAIAKQDAALVKQTEATRTIQRYIDMNEARAEATREAYKEMEANMEAE